MEKIYIPGILGNRDELHDIEKLFKEQNMSVVSLSKGDLFFSKMNQNDIRKFIMQRIDYISRTHDGVHLICHSMGCNLGVIASEHPSVESLTLVSPEFKCTSRLERKKILRETSEKYQHESSQNLSAKPLGEQLLQVGLFLRSRRWALKKLSSVPVPIQVFYSEGDPFVSKRGLDQVFGKGTRKIMVGTSNHNPFLSEKGPELVKRLKWYYGE